jgi:hypothetical protein
MKFKFIFKNPDDEDFDFPEIPGSDSSPDSQENPLEIS